MGTRNRVALVLRAARAHGVGITSVACLMAVLLTGTALAFTQPWVAGPPSPQRVAIADDGRPGPADPSTVAPFPPAVPLTTVTVTASPSPSPKPLPSATPRPSPGATPTPSPARPGPTSSPSLVATPAPPPSPAPVLTVSIQQLWATSLGSQHAYPYPDGDVVLQADATVSLQAGIDWLVDYGDGTAPQHQATPAKTCGATRAGTTMLNQTFPDHVYAVGGFYTVTATATATGCDGAPGPSTTASTTYHWIPAGGVAIDPGAVRSFAPLASWSPPQGYTPPGGMVVWPPSRSDPDWGSAPQLLNCTGPASAAPGQQVTITCTYESTDASDPVQFSCPYGPCPFSPGSAVPVAGTWYGSPAELAVTNIVFAMPKGYAAVEWVFSAHQGGTLVANTVLDVVAPS